MFIRSSKIKKFLIIINVFLLFIIILITPLEYYAYNTGFYNTILEKNGVYCILDKSDALNASNKIIDFFKYGNDADKGYPEISVRYVDEGRNESISFTVDEVSHLYDVRRLLTAIFITYIAVILLFLIMMVLLVERNAASILYNTGLVFLSSSILMIVFITVLYFMGRNFPVLFENFHRVFFPGGNYAFPRGSLIITLFPFGFFYDFFVRLIMASAIISVTLLMAGAIFIFILKITKNKKII